MSGIGTNIKAPDTLTFGILHLKDDSSNFWPKRLRYAYQSYIKYEIIGKSNGILVKLISRKRST